MGGSHSFGVYDATLAFMSDSDSSNIDRVGHRRWLIAPGLHTVGIGFAEKCMAINVQDGYTRDSSTRVAWPAQLMPTKFFSPSDAWSLSLGTTTSKQSVSVKLVRSSDSKTWNFSSSKADGYFNVDSTSYGQDASCVIFQPNNLTSIKDGDRFNVTVTIAGGSTIQYSVEFFDSTLGPSNTPTSISIGPSDSISLNVGDTLQLSARIQPSSVKCGLKWESNDIFTVNVDEDGLITAKRSGTAHITVSTTEPNVQGKYISATATITVVDPTRPTSVRFEPAGPLELSIGDTVQLRMVPEPEGSKIPEDAIPGFSTFAVDNNLLSIDRDLKLTALKAGSGELRCSLTLFYPREELEGNPIPFVIYDPEVPASLTLEPDTNVQLGMDETLQLHATLKPATAGGLLWSSANPAVVEVSDSGLVTPVGGGETSVTVKTERKGAYGSQLYATVFVKVVDPNAPTGLKLDRSGTIDLDTSQTLSLSATLQPASARSDLIWSSSVPGVASVNQSGTVNLSTGSTLQLTATLQPSNAQSALEWLSSRDEVARVSGGLATPVSEGQTVITVRTVKTDIYGSRPSASVTVNVSDPYKPTGIQLSPSGSVDLNTNATLHLTATLEPSGARSEITWSSGMDSVARVDASGTVTGISPGTVAITATAAKKSPQGKTVSASMYVRVIDPSLPTGVALDQSGTVYLEMGKTLQFNATVSSSTAQTGLTWNSSQSSVAHVDTQGRVTPVAEGQATITVTTAKSGASGGPYSDSAIVKVFDPNTNVPTGIKLSHSGTVEIDPGQVLVLNATLQPSGARSDLIWSSSQPGIATVNQNDYVEPVASGTTVISVKAVKKSASGQELSASVTVRVTSTIDDTRPSSVALSPSGTVNLDIDKTLQLTATLKPATAKSDLEWTSSDGTVASVSASGLVTPVGEGSTVITARAVKSDSYGNRPSASVTVKVSDPYKPTAIRLNYTDTVDLDIHKTLQLVATLEPANASSELEWTTGSEDIATVDSSGQVTAVGEGTVAITATARKRNPQGGLVWTSAYIRVVDPSKPTGITLNKTGAVDLNIDKTLQLTATLQPATARSELSWTSSSDDIATVNCSGLVTPISEGQAVITVRTVQAALQGSGPSARVTVNVVDPYKPTGLTISPSGQPEVKLHGTLQLTARLEPDTARSEITWSSGYEAGATVTSDGLVTGLQEGTVAITATARKRGPQGQIVKATVYVNVVDPERPNGVTLNPSGSVSLEVGKTLQLNAVVASSTAQTGLTWSSSKPGVADVSAQGMVTPVSEGQTTISVTTTKANVWGNPCSASVVVQVIDPNSGVPTGISLSRYGALDFDPNEVIELDTSQICLLNATLQPASAKSDLTWSSSRPSIATVSQSGRVEPVGDGTTVISVKAVKKSASGQELSANVTVRVTSTIDTERPTGISLKPSDSVELEIEDTLQLTATLQPANAKSALRWKSMNEAAAQVSDSGLVTPVSEGQATIRVETVKLNQYGYNLAAYLSVHVVDSHKPTSVTIGPSDLSTPLKIHDTLQLSATLEPAGAHSKLTWESLNNAVATVSGDGLVTAVARGTVGIRVTAAKKSPEGRTVSALRYIEVVDPSLPTDLTLD